MALKSGASTADGVGMGGPLVIIPLLLGAVCVLVSLKTLATMAAHERDLCRLRREAAALRRVYMERLQAKRQAEVAAAAMEMVPIASPAPGPEITGPATTERAPAARLAA